MYPAVNDPVHVIDADGGQAPGVVVSVEGPAGLEVIGVRVDVGPSARIGTRLALTWNDGVDVLQVEVLVIQRSVVDGVPAVDLTPQGAITKVQRRRYVRVPVQRAITVELDPLPLEAEPGSPTRATGLTLDISEASVCCSLSERHSGAFTPGTAVRVAFDLDGLDYTLRGNVAQVRHIRDKETPRVELVVMLEIAESERTTIRKALFAEQIRMRSLT
jgi:c-di-GMP-binding flagellar brake protein YcgR